MGTNIKPKLDGAGSTLPKVDANAHPWVNSTREEDEFITVGVPAEGVTVTEESINGAGLAVYTFKNSPNIPTQINSTCIGWCTDSIYAKWPGADGWEKLIDCGNIGTNGQSVVEEKMYCPNGTIAPITESGSYNTVYFRNVAMTRVLAQDYDDNYPTEIKDPSQACVEENNGQRWAILRLAGSHTAEVPTFHLLVREVQGILNSKGYIPSGGCITFGSFIGSQTGVDSFINYDLMMDEMATCREFINGESAATILDFIEYEKCNAYGMSGGVIIREHICGYGKNTTIIANTTPDSADDYYPIIPGMMANPWPNQEKTCESGFFISFNGYNTNSWSLGKAALDLRSGQPGTCYDFCTYRTVFAKDVTTCDLSSEVIEAYQPDTRGGLWARYFSGSADIWDQVKAKNLMCGMDEEVKAKVLPSEESLGRVGVYVNGGGAIIAVRSGVVLGDEVIASQPWDTWRDIIVSRTHESWMNCDGTSESYIYCNGKQGDPFYYIAGYEGCSRIDTEFMGCMNYTRKMQFGEDGYVYGNGYCGLAPIIKVVQFTICTGDDGIKVEDAGKFRTVTIYNDSRSACAKLLPEGLSFNSETTDTHITVDVDLDAIFSKENDGYASGQSKTFNIGLNIEQDAEDVEKGVYYPDPDKKYDSTKRWVPFKKTSSTLGYIGS